MITTNSFTILTSSALVLGPGHVRSMLASISGPSAFMTFVVSADGRVKPTPFLRLQGGTVLAKQKPLTSPLYAIVAVQEKVDHPDQFNHPGGQISLLAFLKLKPKECDLRPEHIAALENMGVTAMYEVVEMKRSDLRRNSNQATLKMVEGLLGEAGLSVGMTLSPELLEILKDPSVREDDISIQRLDEAVWHQRLRLERELAILIRFQQGLGTEEGNPRISIPETEEGKAALERGKAIKAAAENKS